MVSHIFLSGSIVYSVFVVIIFVDILRYLTCFFYITLWIYCVFSICGDYIGISIHDLNKWYQSTFLGRSCGQLLFIFVWCCPTSRVSIIKLWFSIWFHITCVVIVFRYIWIYCDILYSVLGS